MLGIEQDYLSFHFADTFIQRTKKLYIDTRTQRNINKLNEDLTEVHSIMTKNIQDVLGQGEKLDSKSLSVSLGKLAFCGQISHMSVLIQASLQSLSVFYEN